MRVLQLHCFYRRPGGEDLLARQEAELLRARGHEVQEVRRSNEEALSGGPIATTRVLATSAWNPEAYEDVRAEIQMFKPDVLHVQNFWFALSPSVFGAAHDAGVPTVLVLNNYRLVCPGAYLMRDGEVCEQCVGRSPWRAVAHACYRGSRPLSALVARMIMANRQRGTWDNLVDAYIANTPGARRRFIRGGLPPGKVHVKPNSLNSDPGPGEGQREGALFVGRLSHEKGVGVLRTAWSEMGGAQMDARQKLGEARLDARQKLGEARLDVLGDGPELDALQAAAVPGISLAGWVEEAQVIEAMQRASFLIMPSLWYEGMPTTLVQAYACGLPVVASRLGALAELVIHGETGLLFEPGDAADLARQCRRLLDDPGEALRMGDSARRVFEQEYTADAEYRRLMAIYEGVIRTRR